MRKITAFILIMVISLIFLSSCGSEKKSAVITSGTENAGKTEKNLNADGVSNTIASNISLNAEEVSKNYGQIMSKIAVSRRQVEQPASGAESAAGYYQKALGKTIASPLTNSTYELKFIDDFGGTSLDTNNWTINNGNYNASEGQANITENIVVQNGNLNIYGKKDTVLHQRWTNWGSALSDTYYTGGAINSRNKKLYEYGRIEMLAKLPYSQGMWPAFWSMGEKNGWPACGEIDILELVGGLDPWNHSLNRDGQYNTTIHWSDAYGREKSKGSVYTLPNQSSGGKLNDAWHVIGIEWTNTKIMGYIDNIKFFDELITDPNMNIDFHQKHWMILNLAMGSRDNSGNDTWASAPDGLSPTVWPQDFQIDWVKVWQVKN